MISTVEYRAAFGYSSQCSNPTSSLITQDVIPHGVVSGEVLLTQHLMYMDTQ